MNYGVSASFLNPSQIEFLSCSSAEGGWLGIELGEKMERPGGCESGVDASRIVLRNFTRLFICASLPVSILSLASHIWPCLDEKSTERSWEMGCWRKSEKKKVEKVKANFGFFPAPFAFGFDRRARYRSSGCRYR